MTTNTVSKAKRVADDLYFDPKSHSYEEVLEAIKVLEARKAKPLLRWLLNDQLALDTLYVVANAAMVAGTTHHQTERVAYLVGHGQHSDNTFKVVGEFRTFEDAEAVLEMWREDESYSDFIARLRIVQMTETVTFKDMRFR